MERDAYAWAAARDIGTATRALVERLSAANSAGEAAAVLRDALAWFSHPPPEESETTSGSDAREVPAWPAALRRHAALLGWPQLQRLWLEDQFPAWATAVLTGVVCLHSTAPRAVAAAHALLLSSRMSLCSLSLQLLLASGWAANLAAHLCVSLSSWCKIRLPSVRRQLLLQPLWSESACSMRHSAVLPTTPAGIMSFACAHHVLHTHGFLWMSPRHR